MLDNSAKPVLHLKLGSKPATAPSPPKRESTFRPSAPSLGNPIDPPPPTAPAPKKKLPPPVTWATYRAISAEIPAPPFDFAKSPTPEQWASYNETLTKRQRKARRYAWVVRACAIFAGTIAPRGDDMNRLAFRFAQGRQQIIFGAFGLGKKRTEVIEQLQVDFAHARIIVALQARAKA